MTLLDLAQKKFAGGRLTAGENNLFTSTERGEVVVPLRLPGFDEENPDSLLINAECLAWLCTDREASLMVTYGGIRMEGMHIEGDLHLEDAQMPFPMAARRCKFDGSIYLTNARVRSLNFSQSSVQSLECLDAYVEGNVYLRKFEARAGVSFTAATIGGRLDCSGAQLTNPNGYALTADGAKINGSVFLTDWKRRFMADGGVSLVKAKIAGDLDCLNAHLSNSQHPALIADRAYIDGSVFLQGDFRAEGEVTLADASIGGNLDCQGACMNCSRGTALSANSARVQGSVFLRGQFRARGEVNLNGATIGGNLECDGAQLSAVHYRILSASKIKIAGNVFLRGGFTPDGYVDFSSAEIAGYFLWSDVSTNVKTVLDLRTAKVATLWDDEKSWPREGNLFLDGFTYDRIHDAAPNDARSRIKWLDLQPKERFLHQPYEHLAAVFRNAGREANTRRVLVRKSQEIARWTRFPHHGWWWYNFFGKAVGYGYVPSRPLLISLGMIFLGTIVFHLGYLHDLIAPTNEIGYVKDAAGRPLQKNGRHVFSENYPQFNAFVYSLESFAPLVKLDMSAHWRPDSHRGGTLHFKNLRFGSTSGGVLQIYLWYHIVAGWILTSWWVGLLTGIVKS